MPRGRETATRNSSRLIAGVEQDEGRLEGLRLGRVGGHRVGVLDRGLAAGGAALEVLAPEADAALIAADPLQLELAPARHRPRDLPALAV